MNDQIAQYFHPDFLKQLNHRNRHTSKLEFKSEIFGSILGERDVYRNFILLISCKILKFMNRFDYLVVLRLHLITKYQKEFNNRSIIIIKDKLKKYLYVYNFIDNKFNQFSLYGSHLNYKSIFNKYNMTEIECLRIQQDQMQALTHIYLEQLQMVKQTAPYKFNILCKPFSGNELEYQLNIMFEFGKSYPKTPIKYEFQPLAGITRDNITSITKKIQEVIISNKSKPVIYDIVEEARLWIEQFLVEGRAYEIQEVVKVKKEEVFERPKFASFTIVTPENFLAWKKQFDLKHKQLKIEKKQTEQKKPTGKQWFLGKQGQIEESEDQDEEDQEDQEEQAVQIPTEQNNDLF